EVLVQRKHGAAVSQTRGSELGVEARLQRPVGSRVVREALGPPALGAGPRIRKHALARENLLEGNLLRESRQNAGVLRQRQLLDTRVGSCTARSHVLRLLESATKLASSQHV